MIHLLEAIYPLVSGSARLRLLSAVSGFEKSDSKCNTTGALDNAAGLAVLMETARRLILTDYSVDIVPFNGEEYYGASGELTCLQHLEASGETVSLLINIDSPCHMGADNAVSFYNFDPESKETPLRLFDRHTHAAEGGTAVCGRPLCVRLCRNVVRRNSVSELFEG